MNEILKAPFPWFGGKSRAADLIWPRFGKVVNYVEPFAGSLAVLLRRPIVSGNEIVNDLDCYVTNAWRAMKLAPQEVAGFCDWPVNEADLHARHRWLHGRLEFRKRMENEPDYFDAKIAGYWIWGLSCWIGDNFCRPKNQAALPCLNGKGISVKIPKISEGPTGVSRQVRHLTGNQGSGKRPNIDRKNGRGVFAMAADVDGKRPSVHSWKGTESLENLIGWFDRLAERLRFTKVCCGDWQRVCTKAATFGQGMTAVLLDPPYDPDIGCATVYGDLHPVGLSGDVREWAIEAGKNPLMRIALCGYDGEHDMPPDWDCVAWKASGGYAAAAGNNENSERERIWFSPACIKPQPELFPN